MRGNARSKIPARKTSRSGRENEYNWHFLELTNNVRNVEESSFQLKLLPLLLAKTSANASSRTKQSRAQKYHARGFRNRFGNETAAQSNLPDILKDRVIDRG